MFDIVLAKITIENRNIQIFKFQIIKSFTFEIL